MFSPFPELTNPWGVKVTLVEVKDVELPEGCVGAWAARPRRSGSADEEFFASYLPALTVRKGTEKLPQLRELFAPVAEALDTATMRELNSRVDVEGEQPEDVTRAFLTEKDLIGS